MRFGPDRSMLLLLLALPLTASPAPPGRKTLEEVLADSPAWRRAAREPDPVRIEQLRSVEPGWSVEVAYGAWCSDSVREMPLFISTLKRMEEQAPAVLWFAVDRAKKEPAAEIRRLRIERVPTFVTFREGREIGRVVERAEPSIEEALLRILASPADPAAPALPDAPRQPTERPSPASP